MGCGLDDRPDQPPGTTAYFYERRGLLRREERAFTGFPESYVTSFRFDANGNRSSLGYPSGTTVTYTVDYAGRHIAAAAAAPGGTATLVSLATYLPFGPATSVAFGNGTTQTMTYDSRYRITRNKLAATSTLAQYDYGYDPAGNITSIADALDAGYTRTFAYDDLNRLITANTGTSLWRTGSYSYDAMGNMLSLRLGEVLRPPEPGDQSRLRPRSDVSTLPLGRVTTFAYSGTTPKISTVINNDLERPVTYDAAGNEIAYAIQRTYSARNLLSSVIEPLEGMTHRIDYGYDGRGLRVRRSEPPAAGGNSTRYFLYSPELQLLSVTNDDIPNPWLRGPRLNAAAPSIRTEIIWFGGRPIAQVTNGTTLTYTFTDHLGTPILQTSSSPTPTITWRAEHEPFGNIYEMRVGNRTDQPLRFPGQEVAMALEGQEENYNVHRWFKSGWGRYTSSDPLEELHHLEPNLYLYARARPTALMDPLGLISIDRRCYGCVDGFDFGDPDGRAVERGATRACAYRRRPKCRQLTEHLQFGPTLDTNRVEPLGQCMDRLCDGDLRIYCARNTDSDFPRACARANNLGGSITLLRSENSGDCYFDQGAGWSHTIFHEMVHVCGLTDRRSESYGTGPYSALYRKIMWTCAGVLN